MEGLSIGLAIVGFAILVAYLLLRDKGEEGPSQWGYTVGPLWFCFDGTISRAVGKDFAIRLHAYYTEVWPCLAEAYGLTGQLKVEGIFITEEPWIEWATLPNGETEEVEVNGAIYYNFPFPRIRLALDEEGVGALPWELRNAARWWCKKQYPGEWQSLPGDEAARECLEEA